MVSVFRERNPIIKAKLNESVTYLHSIVYPNKYEARNITEAMDQYEYLTDGI